MRIDRLDVLKTGRHISSSLPPQSLGPGKLEHIPGYPGGLPAVVLLDSRTTGNHFIRNFEVSAMLTAHNGLPLYIGQTNENPALTGTNQQRPYDVNPAVSLYAPEVPNGTGVQYLLPTSAANFSLEPSGPLFVGSGLPGPRCYLSASAVWVET